MNGKSSSPMNVFFCIVTNKKNGENRRKKNLLTISLVVQASITYKVFFISLPSQ